MHLELISATWAPFLDPFNQGDGSLALCRTSARSVANGKHSHSWEESQETAEDWSRELWGGQAGDSKRGHLIPEQEREEIEMKNTTVAREQYCVRPYVVWLAHSGRKLELVTQTDPAAPNSPKMGTAVSQHGPEKSHCILPQHGPRNTSKEPVFSSGLSFPF